MGESEFGNIVHYYGTNDNDNDGGDDPNNFYHRPRRCQPDMIQYLLSLPIDLRVAKDQVLQYKQKQQQRTNIPDNEDVDEKNENDDEEESSLHELEMIYSSLNVVDDIQSNLASLACDSNESCSQQIEKLVYVSCHPDLGCSYKVARRLLHSLKGYWLHLSCHRYGSHVAQTILEVAGSSNLLSYEQQRQRDKEQQQTEEALENHSNNEQTCYSPLIPEDDDEDENENVLPTLQECILQASDELLSQARLLSKHVCGSHVLRSLLCILMGVTSSNNVGDGVDSIEHVLKHKPNLDNDHGASLSAKKKKKKKRKKQHNEAGTNNESGRASSSLRGSNDVVLCPVQYDVKSTKKFQTKLQCILEQLLGCPLPAEENETTTSSIAALELICHPSAGPLMNLVQKGLTVSGSSSTDHFVFTDTTVDSFTNSRRGIIPPELKFSPNSMADKFVKCILHLNDSTTTANCSDVIYTLCGDLYGSHFLELVLCTSYDELYSKILEGGTFFDASSTLKDFVEHDVSNFVIQTILRTLRTKDQAEQAIKMMLPLVVDGTLVNGGGAEQQRKLRRGGVLWRFVEMSSKWNKGQEKILKSLPRGMGGMSNIQECIEPLLSLQQPQERLSMDVNGARTIYNLLRFNPPRLCQPILDGIVVNLDSKWLHAMAKDGIASCCIIDGILESPNIHLHPFVDAIPKLFQKLKPHLYELAFDRIGHHTVIKLFFALTNWTDKMTMAQDLVANTSNWNESNIGRKVYDELCLRDFNYEEVWKQSLEQRQRQKQSSFHKMMTKHNASEDHGGQTHHPNNDIPSSNDIPNTATGGSTSNDKETENAKQPQKKKRKRKRKSSS